MHTVQVIILAAGKGTRMESELPKALTPLLGKTFIDHVLESVLVLPLQKKPIVVVGYKQEDVRAYLGDGMYQYAHQSEQLGTGHAVQISRPHIDEETDTIIVLYADQPLLSGETIDKLITHHLTHKPTITMATTTVPDFFDWRKGFDNYSRVIRGSNGKIERTVEYKDATNEEREIKEVNPCYFVFDRVWLCDKLDTLTNQNVQGEYYLTDLIGMAFDEGKHIETVAIDPKEALGANSKEQLRVLEELLVSEGEK